MWLISSALQLGLGLAQRLVLPNHSQVLEGSERAQAAKFKGRLKAKQCCAQQSTRAASAAPPFPAPLHLLFDAGSGQSCKDAQLLS